MDDVARLLDEIARFPELASLDRRASGFFSNVAEIYERHGSGATRAYLLSQQAKKWLEVALLLKVLGRFDACPKICSNPAIGRQILKCLFELKGGARR